MKKLIFIDVITFTLAFLASYWLRIKSGLFELSTVPLSAYYQLILFSNIILLVVFTSFGLYQYKRFGTDHFVSIFKGLFLTFLIVMSTTFLFKATIYSRIIIFFTFFISLITITSSRYLVYKLTKVRTRNALIMTNNEIGIALKKKIENNPNLGYRFMGFINSFDELKHKSVDVVFVTSQDYQKVSDAIMKYDSIDFKIVPSLVYLIMGPLDFEELSDIPLSNVFQRRFNSNYLKYKRTFDMLFSFILIVALIPLFLLIALLIKLTSRGPVIYKQTRLGQNEKPFTFYKFRTLKENSDSPLKKDEYLPKLKDDPRATWFGKILKRTALDELPQLFNVLKGNMSIVGPRPHLAEEMKALKGWQRKRFSVKPGMTGLWQISGRHELSFEKTTMLDIYYINHISFLFDLGIILKTIPAIIFSGGKW